MLRALTYAHTHISRGEVRVSGGGRRRGDEADLVGEGAGEKGRAAAGGRKGGRRMGARGEGGSATSGARRDESKVGSGKKMVF